MADIEAEALAQQLSERSPTGIADQIRRMVASGDLTAGMRLPTVRDVAQEIGVSVGTIAQAWGILREENVVETRRRGGTRILDADQRRLRSFGGWTSVDLLMHSPDAALLPPLSDAVAKALNHQDFNRWGREYITTDLQTVAQQHWPSAPEAWTAAGGGAEGLWMAVHAAVSPGDSIAVEVPAAPGMVDALRDAGLTPLGVGTDESGPLPADLQTALDAGARAFLHWPDGAFAERHTLTDERAEELHAVLSPTSAVVIEDDPLGPLSAVEPASLAALLPERSLRVSAFCRAFGVDMRTAVIGGARDLVEAAEHSRTGGLGSNSRLLQQTIVAAMKDLPGAGPRALHLPAPAGLGPLHRGRADRPQRRGQLVPLGGGPRGADRGSGPEQPRGDRRRRVRRLHRHSGHRVAAALHRTAARGREEARRAGSAHRSGRGRFAADLPGLGLLSRAQPLPLEADDLLRRGDAAGLCTGVGLSTVGCLSP